MTPVETKEAVDNISFLVGFKNIKTGTFRPFKNDAVMEVELKDLLKVCTKDEKIVLKAAQKGYRVLQEEIDLVWGC